MEELVKYIVDQLVENKSDVSVRTIDESENEHKIIVNVNDEDMGKIIGKGGKIANAIRAIVKTAAANTGKKYFVQIGEKED